MGLGWGIPFLHSLVFAPPLVRCVAVCGPDAVALSLVLTLGLYFCDTGEGVNVLREGPGSVLDANIESLVSRKEDRGMS